MKTKAVVALFLVAAVALASGCEPETKPKEKPKGPAAAAKWESKIGGSYKGIIYSGETEFPGTTTFKVDKKGALSGTYELKEPDDTVVTGKLSKFRIVAKNKLECRWVDKNGEGAFKVTFKDDLSGFEGTWNNDDNKEAWSDWNGKK